MKKKRVVITGMGVVSPIGVGLQEYWKSLLTGRCGIGPITLFDASPYPCRIAAEVSDFDPLRFFERKEVRLLSRAAQFGVSSALLALEDGAWSEPTTDRLGIAVGVSNSAEEVSEAAGCILRDRGYRRTLPYFLAKSMPHATASEAGRLTGFQADVMTVSTACTAGFNAMRYSADQIRGGNCDAILCISTDATISNVAFAHFCRAGMLTTNNACPGKASRPFDAKRDGAVLGEGACCFLLESVAQARSRQARVYADVLGVGTSGIGFSSDPRAGVPRGMVRAMRETMLAANCGPSAIDYVGCHGVSDKELDIWETQALKDALGSHAYRIPMSSVKGGIGIPQNVGGAMQLVATVLAMQNDILPPTMNLDNPDPDCDLDYIPNIPRRNRIDRAMVFAHGFNGSDSAVIVGRSPAL